MSQNRIAGVNQATDPKLYAHNKALKAFTVQFNEVAKEEGIPVRMRMSLKDTLDEDGYFEYLDGAGTIKFEWTYGTSYPKVGIHPMGVVLRTQKFRSYHTFDLVIQGAVDKSGFIAFKISDVPKEKELVSTIQKKVFNGEVNEQKYVKIAKYVEYHRSAVVDFVRYIRGGFK
jgi:hypothetical protein